MKILFQGDSITDAGRDRNDIHNMGNGYPLYASKLIKENHSDMEIEFINLGISGDQTKELVARLQNDFIDINPDVVSIMIGVNDTWHHAEDKSWISRELYESNYRTVLSAIKEKTKAKIIILEQYLVPNKEKDFFREDLDYKIDITRKLAREFADVYVPTDGIIAKALIDHPTDFISDDGVHPNLSGSQFIGKIYSDAFDELLNKINE